MRYSGFHRVVQHIHADVRQRWPVCLANEVQVDALSALRTAVRGLGQSPPSYTAMVTCAAAMAIDQVQKQYPEVNAMIGRWMFWRWLHHFEQISAGVAVSRQEQELDRIYVEVVRQPQQMQLDRITGQLKHAATAPAEQLADYQACRDLYQRPGWLQRVMIWLGVNVPRLHARYRGTFSLTTVGKFGADLMAVMPLTTPVQFGFGNVRSRAVARGKGVTVACTMWLTMAFDRRLLNGLPASQVLGRICHVLETADDGRWYKQYGLAEPMLAEKQGRGQDVAA